MQVTRSGYEFRAVSENYPDNSIPRKLAIITGIELRVSTLPVDIADLLDVALRCKGYHSECNATKN